MRWCLVVFVLSACRPSTVTKPGDCASCHAEQQRRWEGSHHARGQARATTVPSGGVDGLAVSCADAGPLVTWREADGGTASGVIRFTLGVEPLQQFAVERDGRLQVPPLGLLADGGWLRVPGDDVGEWKGPAFEWSGSCAPCHATGLRVHASKVQPWRALTVTCIACHDESHDAGTLRQTARFEFEDGGAIAHAAEPPGPDVQAEVCAACHSRRRALTDDGRTSGAFFDRFEPGLLGAGLYGPTGAVQDEVYEVPSFLMSKMERAGVRCSDCHDVHAGALRAEGNALCTRCHRASVFDVASHHPDGASCVSCHMPPTTFLGVDVRRDHAFPVPGREDAPLREAFTAGFAQRGDARRRLLALIARPDVSSFQRASALALLPPGAGVAEAIGSAALSDDEWLRYGAAVAAQRVPPDARRRLIGQLTTDRRRAVRVQAARVLIGSGELPPAVVAEVEQAERANDFRGDAFLNLGALAVARGDLATAERQFREGLRRDPSFQPLRIDLADVLRRTGRDAEGLAVLGDAARTPGAFAGPVNYALGLARWRTGQQALALQAFEVAMRDGDPLHRFAWLSAVRAVSGAGQAWPALEAALGIDPEDERLLGLGLEWATADHDRARAQRFAARLEALEKE
jgi:predicted CXXCH cytochrome family protein